jgi:nitrogen fixation protein NifZ
MIEPALPKFQWGQRVCAAVELYNDGSFPDFPEAALLVPAGESGEVVQVGSHTESNRFVYMVEFGPGRVVGCFEEELAFA